MYITQSIFWYIILMNPQHRSFLRSSGKLHGIRPRWLPRKNTTIWCWQRLFWSQKCGQKHGAVHEIWCELSRFKIWRFFIAWDVCFLQCLIHLSLGEVINHYRPSWSFLSLDRRYLLKSTKESHVGVSCFFGLKENDEMILPWLRSKTARGTLPQASPTRPSPFVSRRVVCFSSQDGRWYMVIWWSGKPMVNPR